MRHFTLPLVLLGLMVSSVAAHALDIPDLKPGEWQVTIKHTSSDPKHAVSAGTTSQCLDAKTLAEGKQTGLDFAKKNCSKNDTRREGAQWVTDMVCKIGGKTTMTTHSVTTFSGDSYHTEMSTTFDPPMAGETHSGTVMDGKWTGACKGN